INRVGYEPLPKINYAPALRSGDGIEFWGQSFVADPMGRMLAKASATDEQLLITEINFKKTVVQRTHWPYLRDRRIDAYGDIDKRVID
ncbi:MAG TPA: nitrilase-related carbon-nitrogen hydrolase, partial [Pyrinomonadaceae bacterium]